MPTINASRVGFIRGTPSSNLTTARTSNGTTATDSPTTNTTNAVMSFFSAGRGGGTILFHRTYVYFDTSGITVEPTSAKLKLTTVTSNSSDVIVMNGLNAFGGDGGTALANADFNNVDFSTPYASQTTDHPASETVTFTLNGSTVSQTNCNLQLVANDSMTPFFNFVKTAAAAGGLIIKSLKVGYN